MDQKALFNISYGVFLLGAKNGEKINACVINACMQVASEPARIAISSQNGNFTCKMIKETGFFSLSILDKTCSFDFIKNFGYQSGREIDKFKSVDYKNDENGCPYVEQFACSSLSCKVLSQTDLGTHTLFVAEVLDAQILSKNEPLTYSYYQTNLKQKPKIIDGADAKKIIGWRCKICGYEYLQENLPADFVCPICGHPAEDFEPIYEKR